MTDRTNDDDQSTSSEDLIRQAREALDSSEAPPSATFESSEPYESFGAPAPVSESIPRPADYVRSEYADQTAPGGTLPPQATYQAQKPSFFSRFGRLLIFGVIIAGFFVYNMFDKTKDVVDLEAGDCLLMPTEETIADVESTDCQDDHQLEVFAVVTLPEGSSAPYPGDSEVANAIIERCIDRFEGYVGMNFQESIWFVNAFYPTPESWNEENDRQGRCVVFEPGAGDDPIMVTGTARNSNK